MRRTTTTATNERTNKQKVSAERHSTRVVLQPEKKWTKWKLTCNNLKHAEHCVARVKHGKRSEKKANYTRGKWKWINYMIEAFEVATIHRYANALCWHNCVSQANGYIKNAYTYTFAIGQLNKKNMHRNLSGLFFHRLFSLWSQYVVYNVNAAAGELHPFLCQSALVDLDIFIGNLINRVG